MVRSVSVVPELEPARFPDRHCLLIDQGNSNLKWITAVWSAKSESWSLDLTTLGEGSTRELGAAFQSGEMMPPEEVLLCSVGSGSARREVQTIVTSHSSARVTRLGSEADTNGIRNGYPDFSQLGADRWMAIVGAAAQHGFPIVVVDLGTATTLDAIDHEGNHLGGLIVPGPGSMLDALGKKTELQTAQEGSQPVPKGRSGEAQTDTESAIVGGITAAQIGALDQFLEWFQGRPGPVLASDPVVIVTGGAVSAIMGKSDYPLIHDPLLVFKGMLISRFGSASKCC